MTLISVPRMILLFVCSFHGKIFCLSKVVIMCKSCFMHLVAADFCSFVHVQRSLWLSVLWKFDTNVCEHEVPLLYSFHLAYKISSSHYGSFHIGKTVWIPCCMIVLGQKKRVASCLSKRNKWHYYYSFCGSKRNHFAQW